MTAVVVGTIDTQLWDTLEAELAGEGYLALWAATGQEVLALVFQQRPEVVLLEPALPVFDGLETCEMLRGDPDVAADLPVLLVSDDDLNPHTLEKAGVTEVFPKQHEHHLLRETMTSLLRHRLAS